MMRKFDFTTDSNSNRNKGFTLIEVLLYMVILGLIIASLSGFIFMTYQSKIKNQTIAETEQQGNQIMDIILQTVRNATAINSPAAQSSGASLSLNTTNGTTTPTIFDILGVNLRLTEGVGSAINLTGGRVAISNVVFTNATETGALGLIRVQFTLTYINNAGTNEYSYAKTFYGTASLR